MGDSERKDDEPERKHASAEHPGVRRPERGRRRYPGSDEILGDEYPTNLPSPKVLTVSPRRSPRASCGGSSSD